MSRSALAAGVRYLRKVVASQCHRQDSDERLLHAFLTNHDETAFAALVRRYGPMVGAVCRRVLGHQQDAEDAFQATFLVLAQKASRLRKKTALASFLHGTAYRIALHAKRTAARRRKHEGQVPARTSLDPLDELSWREVRMLVDEEVARLPEKYRSVFILCCLEGISQAEAAQRLGQKEGTLSSRLTTARKILSQRLARRGVELTAVLATSALATPPVSALSPLLMATTIQAALATAASEKLASVVSASVADMVNNATAAMMMSKAKIATLLLLTATVLTGAGAWSYRTLATPQSAQQPTETPPSPSKPRPPQAKNLEAPGREKLDLITVTGRVLDSEGKPVAGAKLYVTAESHDPGKPRAISGADGSFRLNLEPPPMGWRPRQLMAVAEGFGIDWIYLDQRPLKGEQILRLAPAASIRGRVIDLEGQPVHKATVRVAKLFAPEGDDLSAFLHAWRKGTDFYEAFQLLAKGPPKEIEETAAFPEVFAPVSTAADGRFTITRIGRERLVLVRVSGADKADQWEWVVTPRGGFQPPDAEAKRVKIQGATPTIAIGPSRPIEGTVREKGSGRPLAGVRVIGAGLFMEHQVLETMTDQRGRYHLTGLPKAPNHALSFLPGEGRPHLPRFLSVSDNAPGLQPVRLDVELSKGIVVKGQLKDRTTGQPVRGVVRYAPLAHTEFVAQAPDYVPKPPFNFFGDAGEAGTDAEGRYQLTILPGPGILMVTHMGDGRTIPRDYVHAKLTPADAKNDKIFDRSLGVFRVYPGTASGGIFRPTALYAYRVIDPQQGSAELIEEFLFDPGRSRKVQLFDPLDKPVTGVLAAGMHPTGRPQLDTLFDSVVTVEALDPSAPRRVCFLHQDRKLAAVVRLRGDEPEPITVKLQPCGEVTGRLLSADGKPLADFLVYVYPPGDDSLSGTLGHWWVQKTRITPIRTGADGRFRIDRLPPGLKFDLWFSRKPPDPPLPHVEGLTVRAGETKDLGDLRVKPME